MSTTWKVKFSDAQICKVMVVEGKILSFTFTPASKPKPMDVNESDKIAMWKFDEEGDWLYMDDKNKSEAPEQSHYGGNQKWYRNKHWNRGHHPHYYRHY